MKRSVLMFVFISIVMAPRLAVGQTEPFITLDRSNSIGLGSFSVQATTDFNFWGWYSDAQLHKHISFTMGLSKRLELSISWYSSRNIPRVIYAYNLPYLHSNSISWINNYLKVNIIDGREKPIGIAFALNIPFPYRQEFVGPYPAIFIRFIGDMQIKRHYTAINVDMHLSEDLYWVSRFGYTYSLKASKPSLSFGIEGYVFYNVIKPSQYFILGAGPTFNFEYEKESFLYFFTLSLTPEFHRYYIRFYDYLIENQFVERTLQYPGGSLRISTGIKLM